jgi:hypothetical protein
MDDKKVIYVDFVFKRKRITSKAMFFLYKINLKLKFIINKLFKLKKAKEEADDSLRKKIL